MREQREQQQEQKQEGSTEKAFASLTNQPQEPEPSRDATGGPRYFGDWTDREGVSRDFSTDNVATDAEILFAVYTYEDYSGSALVIYERDGKLYEVNGGHCSCYGLEGQWEPEETTWAALAMRPHAGETPEGRAAFRAMVAAHV